MADFMTRTKTITRHEYYLNSPTNAVELNKAISVAIRAAEGAGFRMYDDTVKVESYDDKVLIYWEEENYDER